MEFLLRRLVERARAGDREAFRKLYAALYPRVRGYAGRRVQGEADADDLTARVFHKLLEGLREIDPRLGVTGWALRCARNLLIDDARRRRPNASLEDAALVEPRTPLADLLVKERLGAAAAGLAALPESDRELLALRFGDGLSHGEIAALLGLSSAAVRKRCSRALREVREALAAGSADPVPDGREPPQPAASPKKGGLAHDA